jgi:hypothetical protein
LTKTSKSAIIILVSKVWKLRVIRFIILLKGNTMAEDTSVPGLDAAATAAYNMGALQDKIEQANQYYDKVMAKLTEVKDKKMAEIMTPGGIMMGGSGDGGLGFGSGGGLIGGLILGSLLRNGNGGLFGNDGAGAVGGAVLRNPPEQNQANMDLMAAIGGVDKSVAVSTAAMEASQANQTIGITSQFNNTTASLASRVDGVKEAVNANAMVLAQQLAALSQTTMENRYELSKDISADGEKTRALITSQYELNLQRQLADANAAIIELRSREFSGSAARGVEVTTTNNINQMQQQQQQQAQFGQLANLIWGLSQNIRSNNEAINVGSGTLTASPTNTNTNIR